MWFRKCFAPFMTEKLRPILLYMYKVQSKIKIIMNHFPNQTRNEGTTLQSWKSSTTANQSPKHWWILMLPGSVSSTMLVWLVHLQVSMLIHLFIYFLKLCLVFLNLAVFGPSKASTSSSPVERLPTPAESPLVCVWESGPLIIPSKLQLRSLLLLWHAVSLRLAVSDIPCCGLV